MYFDSHVHSAVSPDSEMDPILAIAALDHMGLGITFTEHADFTTPTHGRDMSANDAPQIAGDFVVDFERYHSEYRPLRTNTTLLGLEIALTAAFLPLNTQLAAVDYDFILGAVHSVDGIDIYNDASKYEPQAFCRHYLTYAADMVKKCGFFDSFAHVDYPARYCNNVAQWFWYENYPDEFDGLLRAIADRGVAMEINTSRFGNNAVERDLLLIYQRFKALGGQFVTIGSDAHELCRLGCYHDRALAMAHTAALTPVYFKERKRIVC